MLRCRIFVIGDSISIRYGPFLRRYLPAAIKYDRKQDAGAARAERNLDIPEGANGGDSSMVLAYLRNRMLFDPIAADFIVLNCGLHDIKIDPTTGVIQVPPESYERNLRKIVEEVQTAEVGLIWVSSTPVVDEVHNARSPNFRRFNADIIRYNAISAAIMTEARIPQIDFYEFSQKLLPEGLSDHVHYTQEACACQGAFLAGTISQIVSRRAIS